MLINLDPNPTYHTSAEFPEKAVLVLFAAMKSHHANEL